MTEIIDDVVKYHVENRIAWLSYNRPEKRNAMSPRVNRAMFQALEALEFREDFGVLTRQEQADLRRLLIKLYAAAGNEDEQGTE